LGELLPKADVALPGRFLDTRLKMNTRLLIGNDKLATVTLTADEHWVRLAFYLTHEFTGGNLVQLAHGATVSVEGADELSLSYTRTNWESGVVSGSHYAFRTLRIPRQCLVVTEFSGRLRASDMDAVADTAAIAIAKLAGKELPSLPAEGWKVEADVLERRPTSAFPTNREEPATA